jgi:hypothetical protein
MTNSTIDKDNQALQLLAAYARVMRLLSHPFMICTLKQMFELTGAASTNDIETGEKMRARRVRAPDGQAARLAVCKRVSSYLSHLICATVW